jgi:hypothetical protein
MAPIHELLNQCIQKAILKKEQCLCCPNKDKGACACLNCSTCFQEIFFSRKDRIYNCENITYNYVNRYMFQYYSEIYHMLNIIKTFSLSNLFTQNKTLNICSIGCGPCSELFAINDFLNSNNIYLKQYYGFEKNHIWGHTHKMIQELITPCIFYYDDFFKVVGKDIEFPDILIMNYLLSDLEAHNELNSFLGDMTSIIDQMPTPSIIIINDINYMNPRDSFSNIYKGKNKIDRYEFSHRGGYSYGFIINDTNVYTGMTSENINKFKEKFGTKLKCSSAMYLITKN